MIDLKTCDENEVSSWGRTLLRTNRDRYKSFEAVAQGICQAIYDDFGTAGEAQLFRLVRIFRLSTKDELPSNVQVTGDDAHGRWMVLAGTAGDEEAWNDRLLSVNHQVVSLESGVSPMFAAALDQIGMQPVGLDADIGLAMMQGGQLSRFFHVEEAAGSDNVPAQEDFVEPYGIASAIGLGSPFVNDAAFLLIAFSHQHLDEGDAAKFGAITPFVATLLAVYEETQTLWV